VSKIIEALKTMSPDAAVDWAKMLSGKVWGFKLNTMLYNDLSLIKHLKEYGNVMADAKVYEIPDDMANSVKHLVNAGADIVTVHCTPMWIPKEVCLFEKIVGVTILTSFSLENCRAVYGTVPSAKVAWFMKKLSPVGYKYFVCSAADLRAKRVAGLVKAGKVFPICPSIRMPEQIVKGDDQVRTATPQEAEKLGVHLIVVGRPISQADDPIAVVDKINSEMIIK
jgi:orotidine-5'-phosphate decarboxylase